MASRGSPEGIILAPRVHEKELELACAVSPSLPPVFRGDSGRLRQILLNLVSNAVKFTETGEVKLATKFEETDELHGFMSFSVSDTGIGIAEEDLQKIFDQFYRSKSNEHPEIKGTGLGLFIVKGVLDKHQATIKVKDNRPAGSVFEVVFG